MHFPRILQDDDVGFFEFSTVNATASCVIEYRTRNEIRQDKNC
jgi:hypothetical protein